MAVTHTPARQPPEDPSLVRFHFDIMESICGFIHGEKRGSIARVGTPARHFAHLVFCVPEGDVQQLTETVWLCHQPHSRISDGTPMLKLAPTCPLLPFPFFPLWNFPFHLLNATCKEAAWCVSIRNVLNGTLYKLASPTFWSHQMPRLPVIMRHSSPDICGGAGSP